MKQFITLLSFALVFLSCKEDHKVSSTDYKNEPLEVTTSVYPEQISQVFKAHGGLDTWNKANTLVFAMKNPEGVETTTTDLKSRKSLIETEKFKIGHDGKNIWIQDVDSLYKGNAKFYNGLMFYFYAMPFVLADDGITYEDVAPMEFDGKSYPGIKVSYEAEVGVSPEDEYILYFNPETHQMEWLGYTVTYFSKEKSKDFHFIRYDQWEELGGLKLPKTLQWYNNEGMVPTTKKGDELIFTRTAISQKPMNASMYNKPSNASIVE